MSKTIGILGGMGPEATVYLFDLIVKLTGAKTDQEHIPIIVFNNPQIPDRTAAILKGGPSPLPHLIEGAVLLEKAGAGLIVMPCITAHFFYKEMVKHIAVPFLHLLEATAGYVAGELKQVKKIGLIATDATIQTGLFQEPLNKIGVETVVPNREYQALIMDALYQKEGLKTGFKKGPRKMLLRVLRHLLRQKVDAVMAGCTEIPLVLDQSDMEIPFINPLRIVAEKSILESGNKAGVKKNTQGEIF